ncbi:MAG: hypothetical protein M3Q93_09600 [Gemmatimonadota bacterium]|nr:hypothetical protein [Gemmatimonadota bacterium]
MEIGAGCVQGRGEAEQHAGHERHREREEHHGRIDADLIHARQIRRIDRDQRPHSPEREEQAQASAGQRQQHALGQELTHEPLPAGAKRGPDGDLLRAGRGARQQQIGDVGACDQEHEPDGAQQHQQRGAHIPGGPRGERCGDQAPVGRIGVRVLTLELFGEGTDLGGCLLHRDTGPKPRDQVEELVGPSIVSEIVGLEHQRRPQLDAAVVEIRNALGITPTISKLSPLSESDRPTTPGDPPNNRCHNA